MGLAQLQRALAQLYTDAQAREAFFDDPAAGGQWLGLTPEEVGQLSAAAAQISFFALSLQRKRLNEVNRLLPLTRRALGPQFGAMFLEYARTSVPRGLRKHQDDARAFADFIGQRARTGVVVSAWGGEVARYEAAWIRASDPTCRCLVLWFYHPVGTLAQNPAQNDLAALPLKQFTLAAWYRLAAAGRVRHIVFSWPRFMPAKGK